MNLVIKLMCFCLFIISCKNKNNTLIIENTNEQLNKDKQITKYYRDKALSSEVNELRLLKHYDIIGKDYPEKGILSNKEFKNENYIYHILKLEYNNKIGSNFKVDPVINIFYITLEDKIIALQKIYSIEEEDFSFAFSKKNELFFEYYDSSTGWKKYIYFSDIDNKFYETKSFDESKNIDKSLLDLMEKKYSIDGNQYSFKEMQK
ncbi:hypothetical protein [Aquimarina rhabdastrellae]